MQVQARPLVAEADRAVGHAQTAVVRALSALLRVWVEVDLHDRTCERPRMLVYVRGEPWSCFEPEYAAEHRLRHSHEVEPIRESFGEGEGAERRLGEFYRLFRTLEALGGLDRLKGAGGVIRLLPSVEGGLSAVALDAAA